MFSNESYTTDVVTITSTHTMWAMWPSHHKSLDTPDVNDMAQKCALFFIPV